MTPIPPSFEIAIAILDSVTVSMADDIRGICKLNFLQSLVKVSVSDEHPTPEFIRIPKAGPCPHTGLCRSTMYGLLIPTEENEYRPPVKSVSLRKRGQVKGTRLVVYQSLIDYLHAQVEQFQQSIGKEVQK